MRSTVSRKVAFALAAIVLSFSFFLNFVPIPCSATTVKVHHRSESSTKRIALTFDDGPHPRITRQILSILDEYGIGSKATFFVIGQNVMNYPETMQLIVDSGCEIGNHTFSHKNMRSMSDGEVAEEFLKCKNVLKERFSVDPVLIRPPEGFCSEALYEVSTDFDSDIILWSIDTKDWAHTPADDIARNVLSNAVGGDIVLMHDYVSGENGTCRALRLIIPELLERGFEFVTVSELIADEI